MKTKTYVELNGHALPQELITAIDAGRWDVRRIDPERLKATFVHEKIAIPALYDSVESLQFENEDWTGEVGEMFRGRPRRRILPWHH